MAPQRHGMHKRSVKQMRLADRTYKIRQLVLEDKTHPEIAKIVGCSLRTVAREVARAKEEIRIRCQANAADMVQLAYARYTQIYVESIEAWKRSQRDKEIRSERKTYDANGKPRFDRSVRFEGQCGDPTFLLRAETAQGRICELLGLNAPKPETLIVQQQQTTIISGEEERAMDATILPPAILYGKNALLGHNGNGNGHNGNGHNGNGNGHHNGNGNGNGNGHSNS